MEHRFDIDLNPVSFITIGTEGEPGERTFYLQAAAGQRIVTLVLEKQQAVALAHGISELLARISDEGDAEGEEVQPSASEMALLTPLKPEFRVGDMGIGVDEAQERIVIIIEEATEEDARRARFTATFEQVAALSQHAVEVAAQGRPTCPLCGEPIDAEGHFCARTNGHQHGPEL